MLQCRRVPKDMTNTLATANKPENNSLSLWKTELEVAVNIPDFIIERSIFNFIKCLISKIILPCVSLHCLCLDLCLFFGT